MKSRSGKIVSSRRRRQSSAGAATCVTRPSQDPAKHALCTSMPRMTEVIHSCSKHRRVRGSLRTTWKFPNDSRCWRSITWPQVSVEAILARVEVHIDSKFRCFDKERRDNCRLVLRRVVCSLWRPRRVSGRLGRFRGGGRLCDHLSAASGGAIPDAVCWAEDRRCPVNPASQASKYLWPVIFSTVNLWVDLTC